MLDRNRYGLPDRSKHLGIASLFLSCLALFSLLIFSLFENAPLLLSLITLGVCGMGGLICSVISLYQKHKSPMVFAGLILSSLSLLIPTIMMVFGIFELVFEH